MTTVLHKAFTASLQNIPAIALKSLLKNKLCDSGITPSTELLNKLSKHLLNNNTETFVWNDGSDNHQSIVIEFTDSDIADIENKVTYFLESQLPELIQPQCEETAKYTLRTLQDRWPEEYSLQIKETAEFKDRLEERWGKALTLLRILLTVARELGNERYIKNKRRKKNKSVSNVLVRLHARACQVTAEIITLLENGYADGAMARWRTLHEISVIAAIINKFGEDIAKRYIDHQYVEAARGMKFYEECHVSLGYRPLPDIEKKRITKNYNKVIEKYGESFKEDYGWAAIHLKNKRPGFFDLQAVIGLSEMKSYYKMASYNVHASPHGIYFRLGLLDNYLDIQSGASNAGLEEPGQNTLHTLTQITSLFLNQSKATIDTLVADFTMIYLRDRGIKEFIRAGRKLKGDDKKRRTKL